MMAELVAQRAEAALSVEVTTQLAIAGFEL